MAANTSDAPLGLGRGPLRFLVGVALVVVGMAGLAGFVPIGIRAWMQWFLFTGVFFAGMVVATLALAKR